LYKNGIILTIDKLTENIKEYTIKLSKPLDAKPGQFIMLWIPRIGEIPLSIADIEDNTIIRLIILRKGTVTNYIHTKLAEGDRVYIRGPYGNCFSEKHDNVSLLIAGGTGLAPIYFLAKRLSQKNEEVSILLGFKDKNNAFYIDRFKRLNTNLMITTEDGSLGFKGRVTDYLKRINPAKYNQVYTCGPEPMMIKVAKWAKENNISCEASLERLIRCGIGLCGACVLEPLGLRVCKDGPVFQCEVLLELDKYGNIWIDFYGRETTRV